MAYKPFQEMSLEEAEDHLHEQHDIDIRSRELGLNIFDMETIQTLHEKLHQPVIHSHSQRQNESRSPLKSSKEYSQ